MVPSTSEVPAGVYANHYSLVFVKASSDACVVEGYI
jgi:hypothetical protein